MKDKLDEVGLVILLFGGWAMNFARGLLQELGGAIFLVASLSPLILILSEALFRAVKWIRRERKNP